MNKKLFKVALVLCASILMAVSCSNNNTSPDDPNNQPAPSKETLKIALKKGTFNGSTQEQAIKYGMQNDTQDVSAPVEIQFEGEDSAALNVTGTTGIVAEIKSVKGLNGTGITVSSFDGKNTKADLGSVLTAKGDFTLTANSAANDKLKLQLNTSKVSGVGSAIGNNAAGKFGMAEVVITFTDKSGKKNPVDVKVIIGITTKA